jgi:pyruvate,water dikinase
MKWVISAEDIQQDDLNRVGGKGYALALLAKNGFRIPETVCISSAVYQEYVDRTGLRERIQLELHRKDFTEMRWEEIWDCATRIRNMFLRKPIPDSIAEHLSPLIQSRFKDKPVAVRSSAPEEDTANASFAGLHESYINISGLDSIIEHIRKVWASLWSDSALLYRQEIGLSVEKSSMAVVIQAIVSGDRSGVAFTQNPNDPSQGVIESVYGLNQGLVDGTVEPDRWILDRKTHRIISHTPVSRRYWITPMEQGVQLSPLPESKSQMPPLNSQEIQEVYSRARRSEDFFSTPQDVEWTYEGKDLVILQSRPITTLSNGKSEDNRGWYLSLHRSFENLKSLREKIETELIPAMISVAEEMTQIDLAELSDQDLAQEIKRRWETNHKWVGVYWDDFIPFAHGVRLFGQVYNDVMQPEDTYEFIDLLAQTKMASLERNRMLEELADRVRHDPQLATQLENGDHSKLDQIFLKDLETFIQKFGDLSCAVTGGTQCVQDAMPLFTILREMASHPISPPNQRKSKTTDNLKEKFLGHFDSAQKTQAAELLDLARTSYQLRDDDNVYLGRIEAQLLSAIQEARQRINKQSQTGGKDYISADLKKVLDDLDHGPETLNPYQKQSGQSYKIKPRQLVGQPAGPGISRGKARVIQQHSDLAEFKSGEVLICDAVDPNMTFVVPLASGVVERRGGMLIHGAIIAREYGLPCVTGIPDATLLIQTGDEITVDGYLGIVTLGGTGLGGPGGDRLKENSVMDFEGS